GALWTREVIERNRALSAPEMERVVVAVDPPASSGANADECGIVVAGRGRDGRAYVLADWSEGGLSPRQWAGRAVEAYRAHDADVIVAERNQGGEMVGTTIELVDDAALVKLVYASKSKERRAGPISLLYEKGDVSHCRVMPELEDQMRAFGTESQTGSPDRVDALVWAITELMLGAKAAPPRVRTF
ncbi:MAG: ATP-binding protein, partial [Pseudomonadota bacterium]